MTRLVTHQGTGASCGHAQSGSSKVFVGGFGVSKVAVDSAGGIIVGPGSQNVIVENAKISMAGDLISSHGKSPHAAALTQSSQQKVYAGTGFASDTDPITGESVSTGDAPRPDINVTEFTSNYGTGVIDLYCSGQGIYPPTNMARAKFFCTETVTYSVPPAPENLVYSYTMRNDGRDTSQPQTVGFWKFGDRNESPDQAVLPDAGVVNFPGAELIATEEVPSLVPGQTHSGSFEYQTYRSDFNATNANSPDPDPDAGFAVYTFGVYADIYQTVTEPNELNTTATIKVRVSNACGPADDIG